jgi:glutamate/tyrosine decarboxylase-like PLP-dependent enzyme
MNDAAPFRPALEHALRHSLAHLDNLEHSPVGAVASLQALRARLGKQLGDDGMAAEQVIDELVADTAGGILGNAGGRFFGWVIGGALPAALAADWLTSAWDQNAASYACGPAAAVIRSTPTASWNRQRWNRRCWPRPARQPSCCCRRVT